MVQGRGSISAGVGDPDYESGLQFGAELFADPTTEYFRIFEVMRDYGMHERTEAPQYFPPVERQPMPERFDEMA